MTAINWVSLILGFILLFMVLVWITGEVSARRKHKEKVELIQLGYKPTTINRHEDER